jgi:hypothetical protein
MFILIIALFKEKCAHNKKKIMSLFLRCLKLYYNNIILLIDNNFLINIEWE